MTATTFSGESMARPAILLVATTHADPLRTVFTRYSHEYNVHTAGTAADATGLLAALSQNAHPVALIVTDTDLPDRYTAAACPARFGSPPAGRARACTSRGVATVTSRVRTRGMAVAEGWTGQRGTG